MTIFKLVVIHLCMLIYIEQIFGQTPEIRLNYDTLRAKSEIMCSNLTTGTMRFYENEKAVAEVWYTNSECHTEPEKLLRKLVCGCKYKNTAACTISLEFYKNECKIWKCGHIHDGFMDYSDSVDVCGPVSTSFVTNAARNFSSVSATGALGTDDKSITVNPLNMDTVSTTSVTNAARNFSSVFATGALGIDDKSITVNPLNIDIQKEEYHSIINLVVCGVSGVVIILLLTLGVRRLCRGERCWRPLHPREIVSIPVESVNIAYPEQLGLDMQATNVIPARQTDSVHLYESIPPSPIADISFRSFADDTEFEEEIHIADAGCYESLDQNTRSDLTYNVNLQDPNTRDDTTYINLKL